MADTKIYTVTEITKGIHSLLEENFDGIWVEGEVSNFKAYPSGHSYFSLKDKNSVLNCVLFKSSAERLSFKAEDGMKVVCRGGISVYDKRGQYQLYVTKMDPLGKGALQVAFEQLKDKLAKEGLFDEGHKKPLPLLPSRVGVVTSSAGAAVRDILKVSKRRFSNIEMVIRPVRVQGDEAKREIAAAIEEFNAYNKEMAESGRDEEKIDVLIVGRGGGSLEDLWPFNEEIVARAIFNSEIPVVSAVGHEVDYTISDFVSDLRAPTPSAAAELTIPVKAEMLEDIKRFQERMHLAVRNKIAELERELHAKAKSYVLRAPLNVFLQLGQQVDELVKKATAGVRYSMEIGKGKLGAAAGRLNALSPLAVLDRGYSITFHEGKVIKKIKGISSGSLLETRLAGGSITSEVRAVISAGSGNQFELPSKRGRENR